MWGRYSRDSCALKGWGGQYVKVMVSGQWECTDLPFPIQNQGKPLRDISALPPDVSELFTTYCRPINCSSLNQLLSPLQHNVLIMNSGTLVKEKKRCCYYKWVTACHWECCCTHTHLVWSKQIAQLAHLDICLSILPSHFPGTHYIIWYSRLMEILIKCMTGLCIPC